jgi:hypothetical protein
MVRFLTLSATESRRLEGAQLMAWDMGPIIQRSVSRGAGIRRGPSVDPAGAAVKRNEVGSQS